MGRNGVTKKPANDEAKRASKGGAKPKKVQAKAQTSKARDDDSDYSDGDEFAKSYIDFLEGPDFVDEDEMYNKKPKPKPVKLSGKTVPIEELEKERVRIEQYKTDFYLLEDENEELKTQTEELRKELDELKATVVKMQEAAQATTMEVDEVQGAARAAKRPKPTSSSTSSSSGDEDMPRKQPRTSEKPATQPAKEAKRTRIPPVVLRNKDNWTKVEKMMEDEKISFARAKLIGDGVAITPETIDDHRKLTKTLADKKEEYHTFTLQHERPLRVVIRGIPIGVQTKEVQEDLARQGIATKSVQRMTNRRTRQAMPLVLVLTSADNDAILQVNRCCSLVVRTEKQRNLHETTQCHRCQRFGHGQSRCFAEHKCVKCGQAHPTVECAKPREDPAKCANCEGPHPASYRGCPKFPKAKKINPDATHPKTTPPRTATTETRRTATSYAGAVRNNSAQPSTPEEPPRTDAGALEEVRAILEEIRPILAVWKELLPILMAAKQMAIKNTEETITNPQ